MYPGFGQRPMQIGDATNLMNYSSTMDVQQRNLEAALMQNYTATVSNLNNLLSNPQYANNPQMQPYIQGLKMQATQLQTQISNQNPVFRQKMASAQQYASNPFNQNAASQAAMNNYNNRMFDIGMYNQSRQTLLNDPNLSYMARARLEKERDDYLRNDNPLGIGWTGQPAWANKELGQAMMGNPSAPTTAEINAMGRRPGLDLNPKPTHTMQAPQQFPIDFGVTPPGVDNTQIRY